MTQLLLMEGNIIARQNQVMSLGMRTASGIYRAAIEAHFPDIAIDIINAADRGQTLPAGSLDAYDGLVIAGSGLHAYDTDFAVTNQIDLLTQFAQTGRPILGSCWGIQIAAIAAGGAVALSQKGREAGFSRTIIKTEAGQSHPFLSGKEPAYQALCIHYDEVTKLPADAVILAYNQHSFVQAAHFMIGPSEFWGMQYHPEFDLPHMAQILRENQKNMLAEGFCETAQELTDYIDKITALAAAPDNKAMRWQLGIGDDIINDQIRRAEIINWIEQQILKKHS